MATCLECWEATQDMDLAKRRVRLCNSHEVTPDLKRVLTQMLADLPTKRDWLDPTLEQEARELAGGKH